MTENVDVAIVGAGSAGLAALREVQRRTARYVLIDEGPLGTTCARVGCMPSKALIQIANDFHRRLRFEQAGIEGSRRLRLRLPRALARVRELRDGFSEGVVASTKRLGARLIRGRAVLIGRNVLRVGARDIRAKRIVLATGSRPVLPEAFRALGARVVTTDTLFESTDLPRRIGVVGLGTIGLEIGQALSRLGCDVIGFDRSRSLGDLTDPELIAYASRHFAKEFPLHLSADVKVSASEKAVEVIANGRKYPRDLILASLGRRPNLDSMGLEAVGAALDERGIPRFDPDTLRLPGLPIFIAGDANAHRSIQHEAAYEGRIAGYNSVRARPVRFPRLPPMAIAFSEPNLAYVGDRFRDLKRGTFVTGKASFETQGRALLLGEAYGLLHVYADPRNGRFLGAEMIGPAGEHLAHLMAWALQEGRTVFELLRRPYYHPTVEEGLRLALSDAAAKLKKPTLNAAAQSALG